MELLIGQRLRWLREISTPRCHEGFLPPARFFALIRLCMWLRGDLNLQGKLLILLRWIPAPKRNPNNPLRLLGFFINLVARDTQPSPVEARSQNLNHWWSSGCQRVNAAINVRVSSDGRPRAGSYHSRDQLSAPRMTRRAAFRSAPEGRASLSATSSKSTLHTASYSSRALLSWTRSVSGTYGKQRIWADV